MIVREYNNSFIMIEQDHHAHISGKLAAAWKNSLFVDQEHRKSVENAIYNHDLGWRLFDKQPFWNDAKNSPFTFIDFPAPAKTVLYRHGIQEVAANDSYAALLCSQHYSRFLQNQSLPEAERFVQVEQERRERIVASTEDFNQTNYDFHYSMLQFCDNVSLFLCLTDPDTAEKQVRPFFKSGIPIPAAFDFFQGDKTRICWQDNHTIEMEFFPFAERVNLTLKQKTVSKAAIADNGLQNAYQESPVKKKSIQLVPTS